MVVKKGQGHPGYAYICPTSQRPCVDTIMQQQAGQPLAVTVPALISMGRQVVGNSIGLVTDPWNWRSRLVGDGPPDLAMDDSGSQPHSSTLQTYQFIGSGPYNHSQRQPGSNEAHSGSVSKSAETRRDGYVCDYLTCDPYDVDPMPELNTLCQKSVQPGQQAAIAQRVINIHSFSQAAAARLTAIDVEYSPETRKLFPTSSPNGGKVPVGIEFHNFYHITDLRKFLLSLISDDDFQPFNGCLETDWLITVPDVVRLWADVATRDRCKWSLQKLFQRGFFKNVILQLWDDGHLPPPDSYKDIRDIEIGDPAVWWYMNQAGMSVSLQQDLNLVMDMLDGINRSRYAMNLWIRTHMGIHGFWKDLLPKSACQLTVGDLWYLEEKEFPASALPMPPVPSAKPVLEKKPKVFVPYPGPRPVPSITDAMSTGGRLFPPFHEEHTQLHSKDQSSSVGRAQAQIDYGRATGGLVEFSGPEPDSAAKVGNDRDPGTKSSPERVAAMRKAEKERWNSRAKQYGNDLDISGPPALNVVLPQTVPCTRSYSHQLDLLDDARSRFEHWKENSVAENEAAIAEWSMEEDKILLDEKVRLELREDFQAQSKLANEAKRLREELAAEKRKVKLLTDQSSSSLQTARQKAQREPSEPGIPAHHLGVNLVELLLGLEKKTEQVDNTIISEYERVAKAKEMMAKCSENYNNGYMVSRAALKEQVEILPDAAADLEAVADKKIEQVHEKVCKQSDTKAKGEISKPLKETVGEPLPVQSQEIEATWDLLRELWREKTNKNMEAELRHRQEKMAAMVAEWNKLLDAPQEAKELRSELSHLGQAFENECKEVEKLLQEDLALINHALHTAFAPDDSGNSPTVDSDGKARVCRAMAGFLRDRRRNRASTGGQTTQVKTGEECDPSEPAIYRVAVVDGVVSFTEKPQTSARYSPPKGGDIRFDDKANIVDDVQPPAMIPGESKNNFTKEVAEEVNRLNSDPVLPKIQPRMFETDHSTAPGPDQSITRANGQDATLASINGSHGRTGPPLTAPSPPRTVAEPPSTPPVDACGPVAPRGDDQ